jgi:hypothetical protein
MGLWTTDILINATVDKSIDALDRVFQRDGFFASAEDAETDFSPDDHISYPPYTNVQVWGVYALTCIIDNWTFLKTDPSELLCQTPALHTRSRLAEMSRQLSCASFVLSVYDSCAGVCFECLPDESAVTGYTYGAADEEYTFNDDDSIPPDPDASTPFYGETIPPKDAYPEVKLIEELKFLNTHLSYFEDAVTALRKHFLNEQWLAPDFLSIFSSASKRKTDSIEHAPIVWRYFRRPQ